MSVQRNMWFDAQAHELSVLTTTQRSWLCNVHSSSAQLRQATQNQIQLHPQREYWSYPLDEESKFLQLDPQQSVWIREITWDYQCTTWMLARMLVPPATFQANESLFLQLGTQAIGDTLFGQENPRKQMQIAQLWASHPYYKMAAKYAVGTDPIWMRRSLFHLPQQQPLMIVEIFLPPIFGESPNLPYEQ